jgi:YD repeat-containing protein
MPVIASRGQASAGGFGSSSPYHQPALIFSYIGQAGTPFAYRWDDTNGIGEAYASPPGWTGTYGSYIRTSLDEKIVSIGSTAGFNMYEWNGQYSGFVRKYAEPSTYSGAYPGYPCIGWNKDQNRVITTSTSSSPSFGMWNWSDSGFGTRLTTSGLPSQYAVGTANRAQVSPNGLYFVMGGNNYGANVAGYRFDNALTAGHLSSYGSEGYGGGLGVPPYNFAWSPDGNYIFGGYYQNSSPNDGPFLVIYAFDPNSGVTKLNYVNYPQPTGPMKFSFNRSGTHLFGYGQQRVTGRVGHQTTYTYDGAGGLTRLADSVSGATLQGNPNSGPPSFNKTETRVLVGLNAAPFYAIYQWSNTTGLGAKLSTPDLGFTAYQWGTFI